MELKAALVIMLVPVALIMLLIWSAWKLAQPVQLRQKLEAQFEGVLSAHNALIMHNRELSGALRAERAHAQQLHRQMMLINSIEDLKGVEDESRNTQQQHRSQR